MTTVAPRSLHEFAANKQAAQKITMLTCYDYPTAVLQDQAGIDIVFVGDSVGTNILGYQSARDVTMTDMAHHLKAVRRGVKHAYVLCDLPHLSYETPEIALKNAAIFLDHGAHGVKLEGGVEQVPVVQALVEQGIDVCGHIGYTPQTLSAAGKRAKVQGRSFEDATELIASALALQEAGLSMIVLELVPEQLAQQITARLRIPTIGIGAGRFCDGQVLVINDVLGITPFNMKLAKKYQNYNELTKQAIEQFKAEVEAQQFPGEANVFGMDAETLAQVEAWLQTRGDQ